MIAELIESLTEQEKKTLQERVDQNNTQLYKFIGVLLKQPDITQKAVEKKFGISSNTYFKNISLAKDEIYDVIKQELRNPYDNMLLPNILYKRGLEVHASKLRIKLEEEYETQGWWNILQEFYNMEMIVAYAKCDVEWLEKLKNKALSNIERLHRFVKVDREAIYLMAVIEKGGLKDKEYPVLAKKLQTLLREARKVDHPIPLFNTLHTLFVIHTRYDVDISKAKAVIAEIHQSINKYGDRMIPYARNVAWLNTMGFHADFATGESPEEYLATIEEGLHQHGLLFDSQAVMNFCTYHFLARDTERFEARFHEFSELPTDKSFAYKTAYLNCLRAYLQNNRNSFLEHRNLFYTHEESRAYNDYDLTLRYLELLFLLKAGDYALAADKLEATVKFTRRNFTASRIEIEKQNWELLRCCLASRTFKKQRKSVFRLTDFIREEISSIQKTL